MRKKCKEFCAMKVWNLIKPTQNINLPKDISPLVAGVICARNNSHILEKIEFHSPFEFIDMDKAVNRINEAMENEEKIAVYGDYDCDGITSTYIMYNYLESQEIDVVWYIPDRNEGYGLNNNAVKKLHEQDVKLIITVDNGISAHEEVEYAKTLGIDIIITDHHRPGNKLPKAVAVINPQRRDCPSKYKELAGVGVALKLIAALMDGDCDMAMEFFGEFAAIGTIGDIVPLTGENRLIAGRGLQSITTSENLGISALLEQSGVANKTLNSVNVAFSLVPRINAAGRLGSPKQAMELFIDKEYEDAQENAARLCRLNNQRKELEETIYIEINEHINSNPNITYERVMILQGKSWHHGVIGIVAARFTEKYGKPVIIISVADDKGTASGRSVPGFDMYAALLNCKELFIKFGGHEMAAGFSIETKNIEKLHEAMNLYTYENYQIMPNLAYNIDMELSNQNITVENIEDLRLLEPFGQGNPEPLFLIRNLQLMSIIPLTNGAHTKLILKLGDISLTALYFKMNPEKFIYTQGDKVDILVTLNINEYQGTVSVNPYIKDIRSHRFAQSKFFSAQSFYERIKRKESLDPKLTAKVIPSRKDFAKIYTYIKNNNSKLSTQGLPVQDIYIGFISISSDKNENMNYCKFKIALDVLEEFELINKDENNNIKINPTSQKADLEKSEIIEYLRSK